VTSNQGLRLGGGLHASTGLTERRSASLCISLMISSSKTWIAQPSRVHACQRAAAVAAGRPAASAARHAAMDKARNPTPPPPPPPRPTHLTHLLQCSLLASSLCIGCDQRCAHAAADAACHAAPGGPGARGAAQRCCRRLLSAARLTPRRHATRPAPRNAPRMGVREACLRAGACGRAHAPSRAAQRRHHRHEGHTCAPSLT